MPKPTDARKARFLAALRIAGTTMEHWAQREGVTQGYVSNVLAGRRTNEAVSKRIASFTEKHLSKVSAA